MNVQKIRDKDRRRRASLRAGSEQLTYLLFLKMADERTQVPTT